MGLFDNIGSFIKDYGKPLNAGIGLITGAYGIHQQGKQQKDYINYLRAQEQRNYQNQQQANAYYGQQANAAAGVGAQQAALLQGALGQQLGFLNQASELYAPYAKVGRELLPHQKEIYLKALEQLTKLNSRITPEKVEQINARPLPVQYQPVDTPSYLFGGV